MAAGPHQADSAALANWWAQIDGWRARKLVRLSPSETMIKPQHAIERLYALTSGRDVYITTEVGQHQMWAAQFFHFEEPNRWMTSGGLGTMGYGLPAAVGVQVAHPKTPGHRHRRRRLGADDHAGDVDRHPVRLPIKIFILNNQWMGMVRQWQELLHGERYSHSYSDSLPDFVKLAEAYGARPARRDPGRARRQDHGDDRHAQAGDLRLPRRGGGELLPDDPLRQGPQRDDPGRTRG